jgi:hypothetical protein
MGTFLEFWSATSLRPRGELTFSLWVGGTLLVLNSVAWACELAGVAQALWAARELTRPLAEVICAAGTMMTISIPLRASPNWRVVAGSVLGHLAIGATVAGASVTLLGVLFATGMLLLAGVVYCCMFLADPSTWPYSLAPAELLVLCACMLALRSV